MIALDFPPPPRRMMVSPWTRPYRLSELADSQMGHEIPVTSEPSEDYLTANNEVKPGTQQAPCIPSAT